MDNLDRIINDIIAQWNPLDVPCAIQNQEYEQYVPLIKNNIDNKLSLELCLEKLACINMGLESSISLKMDIVKICDKLYELGQKHKM